MARPKVAKRAKRPIYFTVERLVRVSTGEEVGALVPRYRCDAKEMRARKYCVGTELRAELKKPRNPKFHRLAHALGQLAVDHIEGFESLSAHDALKRLQRECGVQCESQELDLGPLGKVPVSVPRSIAFDELDEGEFGELFAGVVLHIRKAYWPTLSEEAIEELTHMTERDA